MALQPGFGADFGVRKTIRVKRLGNKKWKSAQDMEQKFRGWS